MTTYKIVHTPDYLLAVQNSNLQKDDMTYLKRKDGGYMFLKVVIFPLEEEYCKSTKQVWLQEIGKNYTQTIQKQGDKIVAYLPLSTGKTLEGIPLLKELQYGGKDIEKLACDHADKEGLLDMEWHHRARGFYDGYKAAGNFTIKDIKKAIKFGEMYQKENIKPLFKKRGLVPSQAVEEFISSLTKYPIAIEVEDEFKTGKYIY